MGDVCNKLTSSDFGWVFCYFVCCFFGCCFGCFFAACGFLALRCRGFLMAAAFSAGGTMSGAARLPVVGGGGGFGNCSARASAAAALR